MMVEVTDAAILRRTVYAKRVGGGRGQERGREARAMKGKKGSSKEAPAHKGAKGRASGGRPQEAQRKLQKAGRKERKLGGKGKRAR